jgi:hypothetical protein
MCEKVEKFTLGPGAQAIGARQMAKTKVEYVSRTRWRVTHERVRGLIKKYESEK